jgi:hypothetical protein
VFKRSSGEGAEPDVDRGDVQGGLVAQGELVIAGGDRSVLFEQVDAALHGVALPVDLGVERRWAASGRAAGEPVGLLVDLDRDGGGDLAAA